MTSVELLVGIDVGTARVKAVAVRLDGRAAGEAELPTPWQHDGNYAEIDPHRLVDLARQTAATAAHAAAAQGSARPRVLGIGVTSMAETGVLADSGDRPLANAIAWHDPRGDAETIAAELGADTFEATTGMQLSELPSLAKILWLRQYRPETKRAVRFYSVAEWVVRRLGGAPVAELSLASRTGLLALADRRPWGAAAALAGGSLLPELVVAGSPAGTAGGDGNPAELVGAALTVAGHDHQTAAYGAGAATDGALFDSLGTAEALVRTVAAPLARDQVGRLAHHGISVGWGVIADHQCVLAGLPTGITLERIAALVGADTREHRQRLGECAMALDRRDTTVRLVDPSYHSLAISGIGDDVRPALLWRVAVDDLISLGDSALRRITAEAGEHIQVVVAGGWLRNPAVRAAKARQFPAMRIADIAEPGAYGAALLAGKSVGAPLGPGPDAVQMQALAEGGGVS